MDFVAAHEGQRGPRVVVHREPVGTAHLVAFRFDHRLQTLGEPRDFGRSRQAAEGQHGDGVGLDVEQVNPSIPRLRKRVERVFRGHREGEHGG